MRVLIDTRDGMDGDSLRGIGFHTQELITHLRGLKESLVIDTKAYEPGMEFKYNVVHFPVFRPYIESMPKSLPENSVVTIHDLIPFIYPRQYSSGLRGQQVLRKQVKSLQAARAILTISETSKKDIERFLKVKTETIHVVYLASREIFQKVSDRKKLGRLKEKYNLPDKFVMYVGDVNYNKNIPSLIEAAGKLSIPLVICGKHALEIENIQTVSVNGPRDVVRKILGKSHPELEHFAKIKKELTVNKNVLRLGFVPDEDMVGIYNLATVYCQPSLYEGFGFPVLEALSCGTPTVVSKTQALVEIAEGAVEIADGVSAAELAKAIKRLMEDKRRVKELYDKSDSVLKRYSWDKTARATYEVYKKVAQ